VRKSTGFDLLFCPIDGRIISFVNGSFKPDLIFILAQKKSMKLFTLIALLTMSTGLFAQKDPNVFLPESIRASASFGMTEKEFLASHSADNYTFRDENFRHTYSEVVKNDPNIEMVTYYFDQDGDKKMYEVILVYKNESARNRYTTEVFGKPNSGKGDWLISHKKRPDVKAWNFKNNLMIVLVIPECEWAN
jgi:hypothetical protein